jgi:hypothetical protein
MGLEIPRAARRDAILILVVAAIFRIWAVGQARFTGDESWFWATARNIATLESAPIYGPSLTGSGANHPGPLFYYLMAIPQRLGTSPWFGGVFVVLLHVFAGWLAFLCAARIKGARAGILFLLLFAFAPWDVLYGDRIWLSCVAPVFGTATLYAATRVESPRAQAALAFLMIVLPQLHMSAPIIWCAALAIVFFSPRPLLSPKAIAIGAALAVLTYAPPIVNELRHGFENTRAILSEGGGKEPWEKVALTPIKVFGYAILYGTSEIGYHFQTGYWRPFDDLAQYGSTSGWKRWLELHGPLFGSAGAISISVSLAAWASSVIRAAKGLLSTIRAKERTLAGPETALVLAILTALLAATALMMISKKGYFPHYTNLLMPMVLVPIAASIDRAFDRLSSTLGRVLVGCVLAICVLAMGSNAVRYYLKVDRLNGLAATEEMVARVMRGPMPVELTFDGFHNKFAWEMIANVRYRRPLRVQSGAQFRWRVRNAAPFLDGELPPKATLHGAVVLERAPGSGAR